MNELKAHLAIQIDHRGNVVKEVEGIGAAMLKLWALQNTSGKKATFVAEKATKKIIMVVIGKGKDFPKVVDNPEEIEALGITIEEVKK